MTIPGEVAALAASALWTATSIVFGAASRRIGAVPVNQIRLAIAVALLGALHFALEASLWPQTSPRALLWLGLSGIAGLAVGDSLYFHTCATLGPRIGTLLMATAPAQTVVLAYWLAEEQLHGAQAAGIGVTLAGLALVLLAREPDRAWSSPSASARRTALTTGLLAATGQALGYVLTHLGMREAAADGAAVAPLSAGLVRLTVALPFAIALSARAGGFAPTRAALRDRDAMLLCTIGAVLGPVLGVWCAMHALAHADTGVAATLLSLNPLLMLPIARFAYGSRITPAALAGTLLAVAGAAYLCWLRG